jgi:hypothetical protein
METGNVAEDDAVEKAVSIADDAALIVVTGFILAIYLSMRGKITIA